MIVLESQNSRRVGAITLSKSLLMSHLLKIPLAKANHMFNPGSRDRKLDSGLYGLGSSMSYC
jgi:hypothetical protein